MVLSGTLAAQVQHAFGAGEVLEFEVSYDSPFGKFTAGNAVVKVEDAVHNNQAVFHITGIGETNSFFDMFYKVRDRFETLIDTTTLLPYKFIRRTREGEYVFDDDVFFDHEKGVAVSRRATKPISPDAHDIISAVYFMRTLNVEDFGEDSLYYLNFYLDDSLYHSVVRFDGHVILETDLGYLPCLRITPMVVTGEVFSRRYPMTVWVTDDLNHIPIMAESEIIIGSVKMELTGYQNLRNPFVEALSRKQVRKLKKGQ
jgi:hypothetical protein